MPGTPSIAPSKICPLVEGAEQASKKRSFREDLGLLLKILPFAHQSRGLLLGASLLIPFVVFMSALQPFLLKSAVQEAIATQRLEAIARATALFAVVSFFELGGRVLQGYLLQLGGQRTMRALRSALYAKLRSLPLAHFHRTPVGRWVTRLTNDVEGLGELFSSGAVLALADLFTVLGILFLLIAIDSGLSAILMLLLPPLVVVANLIRKKAREAFRAIRHHLAQLNAYMSEQVRGLEVIESLDRSSACALEFGAINEAHRLANHKAIRYDALLHSIVESMAASALALALGYSAFRLKNSFPLSPESLGASVGTFVAFADALQRIFIPLRDLASKWTFLQSGLASAERIVSVLEIKEEDAPSGIEVPVHEPPPPSVALEMRKVFFSYREDQPLFRGLDLSVRWGERVAIVGPTGSGKSTIFSLFLRLYDVSSGLIFVGGREIRSYDRLELRRQFALVPQNPPMVAGTVAEYVASFEDPIDEARVVECLKRAELWERLRSEGGAWARLEEGGANLSAGERQLLAIARALYLDRPFVLFDEATAHIDPQTEERIACAMEALLEGRTTLWIAHRLRTVRNADRIVVLSRGLVVEEGTHKELEKRQGLYARWLNSIAQKDVGKSGYEGLE
ncbi:MAG: ABC transporter ATP-binding protein [Sandaracinaceae bacterium]|nr:ABC transporter ATP-binding protein [Sandaracinaceae bacterium]